MTGASAKDLVVVSAGLGAPSSTRLLADRLTAATRRELEQAGYPVATKVFELRDHALDITSYLLRGFGTQDLDDVIDAVGGADGLIAVTPIFTASYSGLFKSFLDILEPTALTGVPVLIGATGGTERHSLALDHAIRPVFSYLHAVVVPTGVFAATADWGSPEPGLPRRIDRAAAELAREMTRADRAERAPDPFALPPGFDPTGGAGAPATPTRSRVTL